MPDSDINRSTITACTLDCPDACSLKLTFADGGEVRLRGNPDHPFTAGFTCKKIKRHVERLRRPDRIVHPLLKDANGGWRRITWDEALDLCAAKIAECRSEPAAMLHIPSEGAKGVLKKLPKLFFAKLGATRVRGSLCDAAGYMAGIKDFGSRKNNAPEDLRNAECIVNWGKDLSRSSVHLAALVKRARKNGARVITISPGGDGNASFSDAMVRIRPGTDRFLAAFVIRRFITSGDFYREAVARSRHWGSSKSMILSKSEAELLAACGVSRADAETVTEAYRRSGPTASIIGAGVQRYRYGGENVRFINALALISGNIGISGGGVNFHLHSLGVFNLDWARDPAPRRGFLMPIIGREILTAAPPKIRMIWINGGNFINQAADIRQNIAAFASAEFRVVVDAFMTDTALRADLILPSALMLEQEDIISSYLHDYVHYVPQSLTPPGEARDDFTIIADLARRLDPPVDLPDAETCFRRSLDSEMIPCSLEALKAAGSIRVKRPAIAYEKLRFDHPDGLARLPTVLHDEPEPPDGYPLRLLTLVRRDAIHSQIAEDEQETPPKVWVAPDCPALAVLEPNRPVFLASPVGRMAVRVETTAGLHPESVIYRRGDWYKTGGGANQLIAATLTDLGNGAAFYDQYVRLENG